MCVYPYIHTFVYFHTHKHFEEEKKTQGKVGTDFKYLYLFNQNVVIIIFYLCKYYLN